MNSIDALKEQILNESDRLGLEDSFCFRCHKDLPCFNVCCGDVNIFLSPYDVLRLKRRLGISSTEFLSRYTIKPFTQDQKLPVVVFKMDDEREGKPCQFVTPEGCSVYEDRPWPCRMYPVGAASARTEQDPTGPEFFFLMQEDPCDGFKDGPSIKIREWMEDQEIGPYNEAGDLFKEINLHPKLRKMTLNPHQMDMYFTACYDLDRFRSFIFESSFLKRYEVEPNVLAAIEKDDEELLKFSYRWLRTCLFNEGTVKLKESTKEEFRQRLIAQGMKVER